jgi:ribosomal protein S18 acetylase RimI-like enzyme
VLWALRVKPGWRGRGIGTRLIAAAEQVARRAGRSWAELEVEPHNTRARALYEGLGYRWLRRQLAVDALTGARLDFELDVLRRPLSAVGR